MTRFPFSKSATVFAVCLIAFVIFSGIFFLLGWISADSLTTMAFLGLLISGFASLICSKLLADAPQSIDQYSTPILENLSDSTLIIDPGGIIRFANKATLGLLGYRAEDLVGKPIGTILEEGLFPVLQGLLEAESVNAFEVVFMSKHGRKTPVSCSGNVVRDSAGREVGIVFIAKDVTEQRQAELALRESEERFRTLFENIPTGVYRMTPDGHFVNANPALLRMLGYSTLDELKSGNAMKDVFDPGFSRDHLRKKLEQEGQAIGFESAWRRRDGAPIYVRENAKVIRDASCEALFYEGTIEDITEQKRIEQMKTEFIAIVSHELRVPLTSIHGSLGWLNEKMGTMLPERASKMIQIATRSSDRMVRLINDMLDFDKIESGKMALYIRPLDITNLVENAIEANQPYADQFGVRLVLHQPLPGSQVKADSDRLVQVITNLLSNASKFSPKDGEVQVTITRQNNFIRVSVTDQGPGIPDKYRSRIFEKFVQVRTSDPRQKGTGLGLSISKAIVEKLGGRIGFEVAPEKGTTFYFDLPEHDDKQN